MSVRDFAAIVGVRGLKSMFRNDGSAIHAEADEQGNPTQWPLYVRLLAVLYVLSYVGQRVTFMGLTGTAALLFGLGHPLDGLVLGLGVGGITCVILCMAFRLWFVRWGRKNYSEAKTE